VADFGNRSLIILTLYSVYVISSSSSERFVFCISLSIKRNPKTVNKKCTFPEALYFYNYVELNKEPGYLSWYSDWLRPGRPGFGTRHRHRISFYSTASRPVLRPTQPHTQWVPGALSPRVKRSKCESDHSHPSSAEVNNVGAIPPLLISPPYIFMETTLRLPYSLVLN
jgi:hypothetical protein